MTITKSTPTPAPLTGSLRARRSLLRRLTPIGLVLLASATALALGVAPAPKAVPLLKTQASWNGAPFSSVQVQHPEVQALTIEIAPGGSTPWHQHPVASYAYVLTGRLRVELEDKSYHDFKAGDAFVEVVGTWHRGVNPGTEPLKLVVFYQAEAGTTLTIPRDKPQNPGH